MADGAQEGSPFVLLYHLLILVCTVWSSGKICARLGLPSLVGEIAVGILLGPKVSGFAPESEALILFGDLGLNLLMIEAGLHVDLEMLQVVGRRAVSVGLLGSLLPAAMGFLVASQVLGSDFVEAFGIGSALCTMSTGIALNVLKAGGVLNQPIGQLIIAAATVNELVNISLLTEMDAIAAGGKWYTYVVPLLIMFCLVVVIGTAAVTVLPWCLDKVLLPRVSPKQRENVVLGAIFAATLCFMPLCVYTGSSELLGSFLAGFCFCTDEHVHHTWNRQVKRVATFLMRFFFACSIGFTIPILEFKGVEVWWKSSILFACIVCKVGMGVLATPCERDQMLTLGFAWGAWGEFSFILALKALHKGLIRRQMYNAVVLAVLISIVLCPLLLRRTLTTVAARARRRIERAKCDTASAEIGNIHSAYYCLQTRSHARWGQQSALLAEISASGCKVIDFRTFHPIRHFHSQHIVNELYLKDERLQLELREELGAEDQARLHERIGHILEYVSQALQDAAPEIKLSRWLPGEGTPELILEDHRGAENLVGLSPASYEQNAARVAHARLQEARSREMMPPVRQRTGAIRSASAPSCAGPYPASSARPMRRRLSRSLAEALDNSNLPSSPRLHHELDGYVHTEAHDAFDMEDASDTELTPLAEEEDGSDSEYSDGA